MTTDARRNRPVVPERDFHITAANGESSSWQVLISMPGIAEPSPLDTSAMMPGLYNAGSLYNGWANFSGALDLKLPEPTNTPSAPSCIISAASAGVATPPRRIHHRQLARFMYWSSSSSDAPRFLLRWSTLPCEPRTLFMPSITGAYAYGFDILPVPASPRSDHGSALADAAQCLSRSRQPQTNGTLKSCFQIW